MNTELSERCAGKCVDAECVPATCGDSKVQETEECDDGNSSNDDECLNSCKKPYCGDGYTRGEEECDDGNDVDTDECPSTCKKAFCGDGFVLEGKEACDDANDQTGDGCSPECVKVVSVGVGGNHACAIFSDKSLKCWGSNDRGQLGLGDFAHRGDEKDEMGANLPRVSLGAGRSVKSVSLGYDFTCAILDDGTVKCWGNNVAGQLGLGDREDRGDQKDEMGDRLPIVDLGRGRTAVAIAAGMSHACAILDNFAVKCWGYNGHGSNGHGDKVTRGDDPNEMGDKLLATYVPDRAKAISAGDDHSCAILWDDSVVCWGSNVSGRLGIGDTSDRGDASGEMGDSLPIVELGSGRKAVSIEAGATTPGTCTLLDSGRVKCWGTSLGSPDAQIRGDDKDEMGDKLPYIELGQDAQVQAVSTGPNALQVCALLKNGNVKCWGTFHGVGDEEIRGDVPSEMGDSLPQVSFGEGRTAKSLSVNGAVCVILDNDTVKCWGQNLNGQLGLGDRETRGDDPKEMGDHLPTLQLP